MFYATRVNCWNMINNHSKRDTTLDTAKGLSMLIIVMGHIYWLATQNHVNPLAGVVNLGAINIFFAISGYLAFRETDITLHHYLRRAGKLLTWLLGFSALFCLIQGVEIEEMCRHHFMGYWFFAALLLCYLTTGGIEILCRHTGWGDVVRMQLYLAVWILIWALTINVDPEVPCLPLNDLRIYYPSYILGIILWRHATVRRYLFGLGGGVAGLGLWVWGLWAYPDLHGGLHYLGGIGAVLGLLWVIRLTGIRPQALALLGKNSLWIYGYHYFFVMWLHAAARYWSGVSQWLSAHAWAEACAVVIAAIVISLLCIIAGGITQFTAKTIKIRILPFQKYLIGILTPLTRKVIPRRLNKI